MTEIQRADFNSPSKAISWQDIFSSTNLKMLSCGLFIFYRKGMGF